MIGERLHLYAYIWSSHVLAGGMRHLDSLRLPRDDVSAVLPQPHHVPLRVVTTEYRVTAVHRGRPQLDDLPVCIKYGVNTQANAESVGLCVLGFVHLGLGLERLHTQRAHLSPLG